MGHVWRLLLVVVLLTGCNSSTGSDPVDTESSSGDSANDAGQTVDSMEEGSELILEAQAGDGQITLSWNAAPDATAYNLYHATEPGLEPANYAVYDNGTLILDVTSPYTLSGLSNQTTYYIVVTAVFGSDEKTSSNIASAQPERAAVATVRLNDTGIDWCSDGSQNYQSCPVTGYPGQDGDFGRDAQARKGTLIKVGAGDAGFDFTKLDANGDEVSSSATEWTCVRDNHTGLVWEVKTDDGGLRDRGHTYTWYNTNSNLNGGNAGIQSGGNCTGSACDTQGFENALNQQMLCGASDWRLPTLAELHSISNMGRNSPSIDSEYFPNTQGLRYFSASTYAADSDAVWVVSFSFGNNSVGAKHDDLMVRLVHGGE